MCLFGKIPICVVLFSLLCFEASSENLIPGTIDESSTKAEKKVDDKGIDPDLSAPLEVLVEQTTPSSVLLSWKPPPSPKGKDLKLFTYSLTLTPVTQYGHGLEREFSLPPKVTSKRVEGLSEGTRYVVQLSAIYGDPTRALSHDSLLRVAAPKFTVFVPPEAQRDVPVGDDGLPEDEPPCNCSDPGMVACTRRPGFVECTCQPGYGGVWCEECAPGNFRAGKECVLCPCSNLTSTAECKMEPSGQVSCAGCLPGHRGSLCGQCSAGYRWSGDRCAPLECLSSSLCAERRGAPGCEECAFLYDGRPATAHRSKSDRSIADGTLPLIAVVVTLGVLLLVAALATCYRYWDHRRHQPRIPFWSIELQRDEKEQLHSHCHYQHLDAAATRQQLQQSAQQSPRPAGESAAEAGTQQQQQEGGRLNGEAGRRTYNTMNV